VSPWWTAAGIAAALAVLVAPAGGWVIARLVPPPSADRSPRWLGVSPERTDPFAVAAGYDLLALCLRAGMPVSGAASVVAESAPPELAGTLRRASELLALGADPLQAWEPDEDAAPAAVSLCAMARRSARAGSSPVGGLAELARSEREAAQDSAAAAAERAGVAVAGPLGLCFLPAFVCLGIVPVVVGLAGTVLRGGVL
jgi:pilus assembly protein TadC